MLKKSPSTGIQPGVAGDEVGGELGDKAIDKLAKAKKHQKIVLQRPEVRSNLPS